VSQATRSLVAITLARRAARVRAPVLRSARCDRRPQFGQFAVFGPGRWWQKRLTPTSEPGDRQARSWSFAQDRSKPGSPCSAFKNDASPQNAPSFTDRGRSRLLSHLLKSQRLGGRRATRATRATPKQEREPQPSFPKLLATTNRNLHDYGSRQQRDADRQSERDPTRSSAISAPGLNEAEFKRIYGTTTRSSREVLRANHHQ
jgi:hypothetical protein